MLPTFGWRAIFLVLAVGLLLAMIAIAIWVPQWDKKEERETSKEEIKYSDDFNKIIQAKGIKSYQALVVHPKFIKLAPLGFIGYGGMLAMQTLWAGPWMRKVNLYSPEQAAQGLFAINLGMLIAFWAWGYFNPKLNQMGWPSNRRHQSGVPFEFIDSVAFYSCASMTGAWTWVLFTLSCSCVALSQAAVGCPFPRRSLVGRFRPLIWSFLQAFLYSNGSLALLSIFGVKWA
jgi:predicted MFS family arabinose efflux permease